MDKGIGTNRELAHECQGLTAVLGCSSLRQYLASEVKCSENHHCCACDMHSYTCTHRYRLKTYTSFQGPPIRWCSPSNTATSALAGSACPTIMNCIAGGEGPSKNALRIGSKSGGIQRSVSNSPLGS